MEKRLITIEGYSKLVEDLDHYLTVVRPQVVKDIEDALSFGDLRENAEYSFAKERQAQIEDKIIKLSEIIKNSKAIDIKNLSNDNIVSFGSRVRILNLETDVEKVYQLVGKSEFDAKKGKISYMSPVGKELMGKSPGDDIEVTVPAGDQIWEILEIVSEPL